MARLTLYFCDLCKEPLDQELEYQVVLSWKKEKATRGIKKNSKTKSGDICLRCYEALVGRLEQEAKPVIPTARERVIPIAPPTPSDKTKPPVPILNAVAITDNGGETLGKSEGVTYLDDDKEMQIVPSKFTDERRREIVAELAKAGCRHEGGFSMEDDGPYCKDCNKKVRL